MTLLGDAIVYQAGKEIHVNKNHVKKLTDADNMVYIFNYKRKLYN